MENISYKEETAKRGGIIGFFKKHYMLAVFMLVSVLISALWYFAPANTDHSIASYYSNAVQPIFAVSILLFLVFLVIKILLEIPKIVKQIRKKFGKYSADKSGFWRKIRDIVFYSPISFFIFILIATGIIFGISALLEPLVFGGEATGDDFANHLFIIAFVIWFILSVFLIIGSKIVTVDDSFSERPSVLFARDLEKQTNPEKDSVFEVKKNSLNKNSKPKPFRSILIGAIIILAIAALIEPAAAPHLPEAVSGGFIQNTLSIGLSTVSTLGIIYLMFRFPSIPISIIAVMIGLIFLVIMLVILIPASPLAILAWAVIFALMRQNRSE